MTRTTTFGYELIFDLHNCQDKESLRSKRRLQDFVDRLCKLLKMKKYGKTLIPHFGHDSEITSGYSLLQFIETSSITGHFSEGMDAVYLNVFSCKPYNVAKAKKFVKDFFRPKRMKVRYLVR